MADDPNLLMRPLNWPPMNVQMNATADQLAAMIARVEETFSAVQWASPFRTELNDKFLRAGRDQVALLRVAMARSGVPATGLRTCVELGCGHGRATIALSQLFESVTAVDISAPHLRAAAENASKMGRTNVNFVHANKIDSLRTLPAFDVFFSRFVFQHDPPPVMEYILNIILPKLNAGGIGYFQISTYKVGYEFDPVSYLASPIDVRRPEMHMFPQPLLFRLLANHGCELLELREDISGGPKTISFHILLRV